MNTVHACGQRRFVSMLIIVLLNTALGIPTLSGYAQEANETLTTQPSKSGSHDHAIAGTVINSLTGEAINRAVVEISAPVNRATMTDASGHFEFNSLDEGSVSVFVDKPGFFEEQIASGGQAVVVKVGSSAMPVVVRMVPANSIIGRVTTEEGEPLDGFLVRAIAKVIVGGRQMWVYQMQHSTLEDGSYRIAQMPPGTYYLMVDQSREATLSQPGVANSREQGYARVFYPGVSDLSTAAPIELRGGQEVEANFALTAEPLYKVAGMVSTEDSFLSP
jgi:Carboxypeptidase regulatory-like domain